MDRNFQVSHFVNFFKKLMSNMFVVHLYMRNQMVKLNVCSIKSSSNNVKFSLDTPMKDMKFVVTEIHEFENWDNSLLIALLGSFEQSRF